VIRYLLGGAAAGLVVVVFVMLPLRGLWRQPTIGRAVLTGGWLSMLVVGPWSLMATVTIGTSGPLNLTSRDLPGSYARLAAGPAGNGAELAAVVIGICVACALLAGWSSSRPPRDWLSAPLPASQPVPALSVPPAAGEPPRAIRDGRVSSGSRRGA